MGDTPKGPPGWLERLCRIAVDSKASSASIRELFTRAAPNLEDPQFVERIRGRLAEEPGLIEAWQQYSYAKRGTPSPYLDGLEVGFAEMVDGKLETRDVRRRSSRTEACADFIRREALWVLQRQQPAGDSHPNT